MTSDPTPSPLGASWQRSLQEQGILPCEITEDPTVTHPFDNQTEKLIRTTTGKQLLVSVPDGLRSPCFRIALPKQRVVALKVIRDIDALAKRVGSGDPAKGIGIAANQSRTLVNEIRKIAENKEEEQPLLEASQCEYSVKNGAVPAFFRYQDPDGNVIRIFNPSDSTPRSPDGSYASDADVRSEGCLSSIELRGQMLRPIIMIVDGQDLDGTTFRITARGPAARLLGHEVSHVNRGTEGLCIIEGGLPVFMLSEYKKLDLHVRDWSYPIDFETAPYLEFSDPAGQLDSPHVRARLADQGLFTSAKISTGTEIG